MSPLTSKLYLATVVPIPTEEAILTVLLELTYKSFTVVIPVTIKFLVVDNPETPNELNVDIPVVNKFPDVK